jgi:hypothetical protein
MAEARQLLLRAVRPVLAYDSTRVCPPRAYPRLPANAGAKRGCRGLVPVPTISQPGSSRAGSPGLVDHGHGLDRRIPTSPLQTRGAGHLLCGIRILLGQPTVHLSFTDASPRGSWRMGSASLAAFRVALPAF